MGNQSSRKSSNEPLHQPVPYNHSYDTPSPIQFILDRRTPTSTEVERYLDFVHGSYYIEIREEPRSTSTVPLGTLARENATSLRGEARHTGSSSLRSNPISAGTSLVRNESISGKTSLPKNKSVPERTVSLGSKPVTENASLPRGETLRTGTSSFASKPLSTGTSLLGNELIPKKTSVFKNKPVSTRTSSLGTKLVTGNASLPKSEMARTETSSLRSNPMPAVTSLIKNKSIPEKTSSFGNESASVRASSLRDEQMPPTILPQYKPEICMFRLPDKFSTKAELLINWLTWRTEFESYRKGMLSIDGNNNPDWVLLLLNRMGPVGQEIYRSFNFTNSCDKDVIEIILRKFDCYVIFNTRKKQSNETIDRYVQVLREMLKNKCGMWSESYKDELIKEKIFQEFDINELTKKASLELGPNFNANINTLSLSQIIKLMKDVASEGKTVNEEHEANQCPNCGQDHGDDMNECPAKGQRCKRCKYFDHFTAKCTSTLVIDCDFCGYDHKTKDCPAYEHTCTLCNKKRHFETKCRGVGNFVRACKFCEYDHAASRLACPARDRKCATCGKLGHFPSRCEYLKGLKN